MKLAVRCLPVVLIVVLATTAFGQIVPGDPGSYPSVSVVNTPHNLNNFPGVSIPGNQVCLPCHTPHNALLSGEENVLWNHAETGETFVMYSSSALDQPEGPSKMCLSCHDGVTAVDNYGGNGGTGKTITGSANLGTDLSNDHPIGIEYPNDPPNYQDPATFDPGINSGPGVQLVEISGVDRVECSSCHEPHNNGLGNFLRVPIQESYLCLQCHIK
ncbi:MAG TPA: cytochrome c3 family protein [Phycisphaerae bacterium]|nr:cytochrome c3 family protein [Phycisphaerae bacterium]